MKIASNKISDVVRFFREELTNLYEKEELELIMAYCFEFYLGFKRYDITMKGSETMSESDLLKFNFAIKDLKNQKPIQYILGEADFYRLKFKVNEHVLIPRPETEELVDLIIKEYQIAGNQNQEVKILDIGTGSGCIAITLKKNIPSAKVSAMDISKEAIEVAKQNAEQNGVEVEFVLDSILNPTSNIQHPKSNFDVIVSNPPYIAISEKDTMHKNVLDYEPHLALFVNDSDPLLFYKAICDFALKHLNEKGKIYFEINQSLASETEHMLKNKGFKDVELIKDLNNNYRILRGSI